MSMGIWLLEKTQPQLQGICALPHLHNLDGRRKPLHREVQRYLLVETQIIRSWHPRPERFGDFHTCKAVVTTGTLRKTKNSLNIPASQLRHPRANPLCWHCISIPNVAEAPVCCLQGRVPIPSKLCPWLYLGQGQSHPLSCLNKRRGNKL